jgi:Cytidylyltransferase-like
MSVYFFPGSFKPPHAGHFYMIESILKKDPKARIYIVISKKPRYTPLQQIPLDAMLAKEIWLTWKQYMYPHSNIHISIAYFASPILDVASRIRTLLKQTKKIDPIYLVKSDKGTNEADTRFTSILKMSPRCQEYIVETPYDIHSRSIRQHLEELTTTSFKEWIDHFAKEYPNKEYQNAIWKLFVHWIKKSKKG